ncbi:MAG: SRPBCC domain-containing protein [Hyphomicrobiaceae bacterium]|nr:SRPBCC domain-containing protein [Hyphomicrobiaceae bacterium]
MKRSAEFTMDRMFDAPRDLVWRAWTEPELMSRWFGPKGCKTEVLELDLKPGGICHFSLRIGDAPLTYGKFVYQEIVPPEIISWHHSFADAHGTPIRYPDNDAWPLVLLTKIRFEDHGPRTRMLFSWTPLDALPEEIAEFEKGRPSMDQGWTGSFEQLEPLLGDLKFEDNEGKTT